MMIRDMRAPVVERRRGAMKRAVTRSVDRCGYITKPPRRGAKGHSMTDRECLNGACYHGARPNDAAVANLRSGKDNRTHSDPDIRPDLDRQFLGVLVADGGAGIGEAVVDSGDRDAGGYESAIADPRAGPGLINQTAWTKWHSVAGDDVPPPQAEDASRIGCSPRRNGARRSCRQTRYSPVRSRARRYFELARGVDDSRRMQAGADHFTPSMFKLTRLPLSLSKWGR